MGEEIITIEEAISRSLIIFSGWERFFESEAGKYAIPFHQARPHLCEMDPDLDVPGNATLRVDMKTYLDTYEILLADPSLVMGYAAHLPDGMMELREEDIATLKDDRNIALIHILFGITDHSDLYWELDRGGEESFLEYFQQNVLPAFEHRGNNEVFYLRASEKPNTPLCFWKPPMIDDIHSENKLLYCSNFMMPDGTYNDSVIFKGLRNMLETLTQCPVVKELTFLPGDFSCWLPTYRRATP